LRKAGADQMLISSGKRWALMVEEDQGDRPSLMHMISRLDHSLLDLVLVEGFKQDPFPKIELHRTVMNRELMHGEDENIIAFATDEPVSMQRDIPVLDINNPQAILSFIQNYLNADND
jgi:molybdopterin-guanine dinucleotide biosynthesis protein MobB